MWYVALGWHAIEFARWQHPAMWHVALESWHWIRQVAAPCSMAGGSGMTCHWMLPNVRHITLHVVSISTTITAVDVILHQSPKFYPNQTTRQNKMTSCRYSRWRISVILDFRGPVMGSLKSHVRLHRSSMDTVALNCLVIEKIAFLCILATGRQTDDQMDSTEAQAALAVASGGFISNVASLFGAFCIIFKMSAFCLIKKCGTFMNKCPLVA